MKHVVIAGGGFAGARLARQLRKQKNITITLINNSPDFRYCPALYRAATGYKMGVARISLEWMLLDVPNVQLVVGTVTKLNQDKKMVVLEDGREISYDYMVFALGAVTTYFNIAGLHEHAVGVKTVEEVQELRKHIHDQVVLKNGEDRNYVVVGAGPTGVEMAAALGDYVRRVARKHGKRQHAISVWLVEGAPRILPQNSERVSRIVTKRLEQSGVNILTNTLVKGESLHQLNTSHGAIKTHTVVWTAGTTVNPFYSEQGDQFTFGKGGKVVVNKRLEAGKDVYVIGDNAAVQFSGLALSAVWHANYVAQDIKRRMRHKKRPYFKVQTPPQVIPVGNAWAILQFGPIILYGKIAKLLRKCADYIGYADVLGYTRALTIWSNAEHEESACDNCTGKK